MSISGGAETGTGMSVDSKGVVDGARLPLTLDSLAFAAPEVVRRRSLTSAHALADNRVSPPSAELRVRYRAEMHQSNPALPTTIPGGPSHQALNHATALRALSAADHPVRAGARLPLPCPRAVPPYILMTCGPAVVATSSSPPALAGRSADAPPKGRAWLQKHARRCAILHIWILSEFLFCPVRRCGVWRLRLVDRRRG